MAKKIKGYREMIWTCPNCGSKNPGSVRVCKSCGSAMTEDIKFEQNTDAEINTEQVEHTADVNCPYCGNRNPSDAAACSRCGADLSDASKREHGEQKEEEPKKSAESQPKSSGSIIPKIIGIAVLIGLAVLLLRGCKKSDPADNIHANAVVSEQSWQLDYDLVGPVEVEHSDWLDLLNDDTDIIDCEDKVRYTYDEEAEGSVEVCSEPYAVETGDGFEEIVQDCQYEVYDMFCTYKATESGVIDTVSLKGSGAEVEEPAAEDEETSIENAKYTYKVILEDSEGKKYTYTPKTLEEYASMTVGKTYTLETNGKTRIISLTEKQ